MPGFSDFLFGTPETMEQLRTGTAEQDALHNSILAQAMGFGQGGGADLANQYYNNLLGGNQQQAFNQFANPYMQQFQEQTLPGIAERFAGRGALSSSGFGQALGGAASGLQGQLAQMFSDLQRQAAGAQYSQYNQLSQTGLNHQQFQYHQKPGSEGFLQSAISGLGGALGGPIGGVIGNVAAGGIGNLFKKLTPNAAAAGGIK